MRVQKLMCQNFKKLIKNQKSFNFTLASSHALRVCLEALFIFCANCIMFFFRKMYLFNNLSQKSYGNVILLNSPVKDNLNSSSPTLT